MLKSDRNTMPYYMPYQSFQSVGWRVTSINMGNLALWNGVINIGAWRSSFYKNFAVPGLNNVVNFEP